MYSALAIVLDRTSTPCVQTGTNCGLGCEHQIVCVEDTVRKILMYNHGVYGTRLGHFHFPYEQVSLAAGNLVSISD